MSIPVILVDELLKFLARNYIEPGNQLEVSAASCQQGERGVGRREHLLMHRCLNLLSVSFEGGRGGAEGRGRGQQPPPGPEGRVLDLRPDLGTARRLDLQPGLRHHQCFLGVMKQAEGGGGPAEDCGKWSGRCRATPPPLLPLPSPGDNHEAATGSSRGPHKHPRCYESVCNPPPNTQHTHTHKHHLNTCRLTLI